ncbi:MAG: alpha/beta hydrolase family protein [Phycisphaerales bacterium JB037]
MPDPLANLPSALRSQARLLRLPGDIPALIAHPDWSTPAPVMLWFHGRTVSKELDPGRYLRWIRKGIAAVAIDLPGHGERSDAGPAARLQSPAGTIDLLTQAVAEIDSITDALAIIDNADALDLSRLGIGGMSAGGMATLRRLCDPHPFRCAAVEATTGWLCELYHPTLPGNPGRPWPVDHPRDRITPVDPMDHLDTFEPIPLLALHSEADQMVPWVGQHAFLDRLADHYRARSADPDLIRIHTWPETGAQAEHVGFGKFAADAKNLQADFLAEHLLAPAE